MIYRFAGFSIYVADNRPFKTKHTREDVLFLPSYILPSYINFTSYIVPSYIFLAIFRFLFAYVKKTVILQRIFLKYPEWYFRFF